MRLIDADKFKENILSGLYIYCQENKEDIARAIDDEPTIEFRLFKEWKCTDCDELEKAYDRGYHKGLEFKRPVGKWLPIKSPDSDMFFTVNRGRMCSICNRVVEFSENYCPSCGADMRGLNNG